MISVFADIPQEQVPICLVILSLSRLSLEEMVVDELKEEEMLCLESGTEINIY